MPNWCYSQVDLVFDSDEKAKEALEKINSWCIDAMPNGFGNDWLGNVCINSGIITVDDVKNEDKKPLLCACRGRITETNRFGSVVQINTESAWSPHIKMWKYICDKHFPNTEIIYVAEEPGCELFMTNDSTYMYNYYVDCWANDEELTREGLKPFKYISNGITYDVSEQVLQQELRHLLSNRYDNTDELLIGDLISIVNGDYSHLMGIHEWDYAPVEDCV